MKRTCNKLRHGVAMRLVVLLALMASTATATPAPWGLGGLFGFPSNHNQTSSNKNNKWSSMLSVDPSKIIWLMIRHGGLVIPDDIEKDLAVLAKVCRAEEVKMNVLERRLLVHNFTVCMPNQEHALRIRRMSMRWDSYLRPCVEIEVDDVHILVDFFNLLLTRNNWEELKQNGFPPAFYEEEETQLEAETSFLRIGSIDLSGSITASIKSRPLNQEISVINFDLDAFDPLDRDIRNQALENLAASGRRGCTTDELYILLQSYFGRKLRQVLSEALEDLADGGKETYQEVNRVVSLTKNSISQYVESVGDWTEEQVQNKVAERLDEWGKSLEKFDEFQKPFFRYARRIHKAMLSNPEDEYSLSLKPFIDRRPKDQDAMDTGQ